MCFAVNRMVSLYCIEKIKKKKNYDVYRLKIVLLSCIRHDLQSLIVSVESFLNYVISICICKGVRNGIIYLQLSI